MRRRNKLSDSREKLFLLLKLLVEFEEDKLILWRVDVIAIVDDVFYNVELSFS